jgi:predicted acylesterase/phospholipase RssA
MTKTLLTSAALLVAAACVASAQSPPASATVTIAGRTLSIRYSAPSVRGRKIFGDGGLLSRDPTYPAWRAGANSATTFHTDADLDMGGLSVPKGTYTLYVWVKDPEAWQLIVSRQTGQWGLSYNASQDLGRVKMTMARPPALVETLNYTLADQGSRKAELRLAWENHIATVPIAVK